MTAPLHGAFAAAIIFFSGAAVAGGPGQTPGSQAGQSGQAAPTLAERASRVLAMQPGDAHRMSGAAPMVFREIRGDRHFSGELIVRARPDKARTASDRIAPITAVRCQFVDEFVVRVPAGMTEGELAGALMSTGDYEFAEPNWTVFPLNNVPNDPQFGQSWQHTRLQSTQAWTINQGSPDVIVAVCDTGILLSHADLAAALVPGYNSVNRVAQVDGGQVGDINGHGTFVAGLAAAIGNNGIGVTGVGWNFSIMPIRVSNSSGGGASLFNLTNGARWAANNGAKVVNVSYSGANASTNNAAARDVKNAGGLLFWAAGNDGAVLNGNLPDLVIVGSTTSSDTKSGFSNFGTAIDVVAPGSSVRSTRINGGYGNGSGTSYASPIAAGVAGLIFSTNPDLSPDDVQDVLYNSVDDLGPPGWDPNFGHGRVNSFNAVTMAQTYIPRRPLPLTETFESASWQDNFEIVAGTAEVTPDPDAAAGESALLMTGTGTLETLPLAGRMLGADASVRLVVRTEGAEPGEKLTAEYLDDSGAWNHLFDAPANGGNTGFVVHEELLPQSFRFHGAQIRLATNGNAPTDLWLIDELTIGPRTPNTAPYAEPFDVGRFSPLRWSEVNNAQIKLLGDNFVMELASGAGAQTVAIPVAALGEPQQWTYFFIGGDALVAGDTLLVEYLSPFSGWQTLTTIDGGDIGAGLSGVEITMPFAALLSDDLKIRFTASTGGGSFFIDDINVGTNRLPDPVQGCSPADLAEPFGELNFFDLAAYLTLFNAGDPAADLAEPFGELNFFDLAEYLSIFNQGCP
ncbi:MAG: S8 family serine peptidase [Phycisphaerales bacterium]|nr:S8 family serine peptidase [Planctomycetota bacterium]MCH8508151.1 S8 family serine peptidase [Phycisphaerales bacterium]